FFRAEEGRSDTGSNHGLGLAIVAAIAKLHGGDVFASSENQVTVIGFSIQTERQSTPVGHP
ncbi:ATP-binding protein, partial [Klebsiella pneumoniae]